MDLAAAAGPAPQPIAASQAESSCPAPSVATPPLSPFPQPATGQARLTLRRAGTLTDQVFPLGDRGTIGRFDVETGPVDVDMGQLPEGTYLSRHHAEIWRDGNGAWFVKDLGSQNGTFVRSATSSQFQRVSQEQGINDGDEIAFGNARFEFRLA